MLVAIYSDGSLSLITAKGKVNCLFIKCELSSSTSRRQTFIELEMVKYCRKKRFVNLTIKFKVSI